MDQIDWDELIADIIEMIMGCFAKDEQTVESARYLMRKPDLLSVFRLARKARKRAAAPRRETAKYMKAIRERCASLTDEECDELYAEATET